MARLNMIWAKGEESLGGEEPSMEISASPVKAQELPKLGSSVSNEQVETLEEEMQTMGEESERRIIERKRMSEIDAVSKALIEAARVAKVSIERRRLLWKYAKLFLETIPWIGFGCFGLLRLHFLAADSVSSISWLLDMVLV
ncbi:hypothetical protein G7Y89_g8238 [Cudoniella acicularis]|uniref:Uncharacterized protein n=1 Tax=Cudoniella acicularis TaxID=354080 RepID=A0A8H4W190_9HELO|nr:hypothetical protein G7Y89_g8238 [Cudoniella acicularis]